MLGIWARQALVGLVLGQVDENVLEVDDAAGDRGGVELVAVRDQVSLLGLGQGAGVQQPVQWGTRSVVEALVPAGLIGVPSDGLAGGGLGELSLTLTCSQRRPRTSRSSLVS